MDVKLLSMRAVNGVKLLDFKKSKCSLRAPTPTPQDTYHVDSVGEVPIKKMTEKFRRNPEASAVTG